MRLVSGNVGVDDSTLIMAVVEQSANSFLGVSVSTVAEHVVLCGTVRRKFL